MLLVLLYLGPGHCSSTPDAPCADDRERGQGSAVKRKKERDASMATDPQPRTLPHHDLHTRPLRSTFSPTGRIPSLRETGTCRPTPLPSHPNPQMPADGHRSPEDGTVQIKAPHETLQNVLSRTLCTDRGSGSCPIYSPSLIFFFFIRLFGDWVAIRIHAPISTFHSTSVGVGG